MVLANKYRYYLRTVREKKQQKNPHADTEKVLYLTQEYSEKTVEGIVLDELFMTKMCCRRHFLTHVNIE